MYQQHFAWLQEYPSGTLVVANQRLARTLLDAYNQAQIDAGAVAWARPDILSWSDWLARLWEHSRLRGGAGTAHSLLSTTDSAVLWEDIVIADLGIESDSAALAQLAANAWKLICDCDALGASEWVDAGLSTDQQQFLRWSGEFRARCKTQGWLDAAQLGEALTPDVRAGLFDDIPAIAFTGFDLWTPIQAKLRAALGDHVKVCGTIDSAALISHTQPLSRTAAESADRELEQAARWARAQLETDPSLTVGIVVPDLAARPGAVKRAFLDIFEPGWRTESADKTPINLSYGEALANKPRVAAALNLLGLIGELLRYEQLSLALRTPFVRGAREESAARAQLDLVIRDKLGTECFAREAIFFARDRAPNFAALLQILQAAHTDTGKRRLDEWAVWMSERLSDLGWPGEDPVDSHAWQEIEAWQRLLEDFAGSARIRARVTWASARDLLSRLAWQRLHQPKGASGAVQIMGILEAAGHEFDRLWVTGMAAADWPGAAQPNPLVPLALQRRFDLPGSSPMAALAQAERMTARLAACAPEVIFSWQSVKDGQPQTPSRLIAEFPLAADLRLWPELRWAATMRGAAPIEIIAADRPPPWTDLEPARGGASLFNLQQQCPLRAFLQLRLGAREIDAPEPGLSYKTRGSFVHAVLENFYTEHAQSAQVASLSMAEIRAALLAACERERNRQPGTRRPFMQTMLDLEIDRILPLLTEFVLLDQSRADFVVKKTELKQEVRVGQLRVRLTLDRLDELADGQALIIDYKTGQVSRSSWNPIKPGDMQLPLYASFTDLPIQGIAFAQLSAHGVLLDGVGSEALADAAIPGVRTLEGIKPKYVSIHGEEINDWNALTDAWREHLLAISESFVRGTCSVNPKYSEEAQGQFAVLTRVYELPANPDAEADE